MRTYILAAIVVLMGIVGCGGRPAATPAGTNTNAGPSGQRPRSMIEHTLENEGTPPVGSGENGPKRKWSQSGNPIDTKSLDAAIADAEKTHKSSPNDVKAKKTLAEAYFKRGLALTEARQYAAALGDYRHALKIDPEQRESQTWIAEILRIYDGLNMESPKPGEEPEPLPFKQ